MSKLADLKTRDTDRQKVEAWLDFINEHCPATRAEVLEYCAKDQSARAYFVNMAKEISE